MPDARGIYAQLSNEHAVVLFDFAARKVTRRLDLPVKPGVTPRTSTLRRRITALRSQTTAGRFAWRAARPTTRRSCARRN
jgi:hypothetical protein